MYCEQCKKTRMRQKILLIIITILFNSCKNEPATKVNSFNEKQVELVKINPLNNLKQVDKLLDEIVEKPQRFYVTSENATKVIGAKGTIIHIDPNQLEKLDASPLGDSIQIELLYNRMF